MQYFHFLIFIQALKLLYILICCVCMSCIAVTLQYDNHITVILSFFKIILGVDQTMGINLSDKVVVNTSSPLPVTLQTTIFNYWSLDVVDSPKSGDMFYHKVEEMVTEPTHYGDSVWLQRFSLPKWGFLFATRDLTRGTSLQSDRSYLLTLFYLDLVAWRLQLALIKWCTETNRKPLSQDE